MFNPIDDVSLFGKKVAGFISGRGMSTTAVVLAAPFVPASQLPIVGLTVGLPIKAAVSSMEHYHREDAILEKYREEIAAHFEIDMEEVTHDNLRILAFGNPKNGDPPQPFFEEILKKNDTSRWVDLGANIGAAALTMSFVFAAGAKVAGAISGLASGSGIALLAAGSNPLIVGAIGLSLATAMVVHAIDFVITEVAKDAIGIKDKTSYEMIEDLSRQKRQITQDKVMSVIANIDKGLKAEIISDYGAPYNALTLAERSKVLERYGKDLHLEEYTAKINSGAINVKELAFIAVGQSSGVPESQIVAVEKVSSSEPALQMEAKIENPKLIATKFDENSSSLGKVNMATPAAISYSHMSNDMPNSINFGAEPKLITSAKIDNQPQTNIRPEGIAQDNHVGMMQEPSMISHAIH
jgi:hypothetical protein